MHLKTRYIVGGCVCIAILTAICLGHDDELKAVLGMIVGYLFGQATK